MKKIIIIDDEPLARSIVKSFLDSFPEVEIVAECNNGFEGIKAIEEHQPDLIFLDIQMPKINGFEMLELIYCNPSVIFTTAFDEYALKAFETSAIDYLLKPFTKERFDQAFSKWRTSVDNDSTTIQINELPNKQPDEKLRVVVKDGSTIQIIPTSDVLYFEAYDDYVKVHTSNKYYLKKKTLNYYEQTLNSNDFLRIHRSFIINVNYLTKIDSFEQNSYRATMTNQSQVPISRNSYSDLKNALGI